jgi:hypothetical protein
MTGCSLSREAEISLAPGRRSRSPTSVGLRTSRCRGVPRRLEPRVGVDTARIRDGRMEDGSAFRTDGEVERKPGLRRPSAWCPTQEGTEAMKYQHTPSVARLHELMVPAARVAADEASCGGIDAGDRSRVDAVCAALGKTGATLQSAAAGGALDLTAAQDAQRPRHLSKVTAAGRPLRWPRCDIGRHSRRRRGRPLGHPRATRDRAIRGGVTGASMAAVRRATPMAVAPATWSTARRTTCRPNQKK